MKITGSNCFRGGEKGQSHLPGICDEAACEKEVSNAIAVDRDLNCDLGRDLGHELLDNFLTFPGGR